MEVSEGGRATKLENRKKITSGRDLMGESSDSSTEGNTLGDATVKSRLQ